MAAWRYEISLLVLKKYFTRSLRSLVKYFSTLEEKFLISARPCNILYFSSLPLVVQVVDVRVGQDLSGAPSKGLYVEEVVVTASRGDEVTFPCHCWTGEDDKITVEQVQQEEVPLGKSS